MPQQGGKPPAPEIFLTPQSGPIEGKTRVRIIGSGFVLDTIPSVSFGTKPAQDVKVESTTLIEATAPAHAPGRVAVIVKNKPDATDAVGSYSYLAAAPLSVTTVTPNSGIVTGGTSVNIIGTGLSRRRR